MSTNLQSAMVKTGECSGLKKLFASCNPTLTSFYTKKSLPRVFSALPIPNQHEICIKHTFLTTKKMQKFLFYRPTYPIFF